MLPLKGNEIKVSVTTDMDIFELDCYVSELKEVAVRVLALCDIKSGEATIGLTDDCTVKGLNKTYRGLDEVTDVLSFSTEYPGKYYGGSDGFENSSDRTFVVPPGEHRQIGEVLISIEQARRQAVELEITLREELIKLVAHGFLHLLGYDHMEVREKSEMENLEKTIMLEFV